MNSYSKVEDQPKKSKMNYNYNVFSEKLNSKEDRNAKLKGKLDKIDLDLQALKQFLN